MSRQEDFLELYNEHHEAFGRYCRAQAFGVINAEELMSESVLRAFESFDKLREKDAFLGFLIGIARNVVNSKVRRKKFRGSYDETTVLKMQDTDLKADEKMDIKFLYRCLDQLPDQQQEALILFEISGYSIKEICDIQKAGESAVKQRLKRGREKLAELLNMEELRSESINSKSMVLAVFF